MLFVLDDSLIPSLTQPNTDRHLIGVLDDLARLRRDGKHLVFGSRNIFEALIKCSTLDESSLAVYRKIFSKLPGLHSLTRMMFRRIEIIHSSYPPLIENHYEGKVFKIPFHLFTDISYFSRSILLAENLNDAQIYIHIANTYLVMNKMGVIKLHYALQGGGGSTTVNEYREIQERKERLCLCLLDNDKKTPHCGLGDTAKKVKDSDDPRCLFTEYYIIGARDIENLFPTSILSNIDRGMRNSTISFLETIEASNDVESRFYFDMKKGLKLSEIYHCSENSNFYKYWSPVIEKTKVTDDLSCKQPISCSTASECSCILVNGFGDNLVEYWLENHITPHKLAETISSQPHLKKRWEDIGRVVVGWCCGANKMSVI
ncbi:MAG: hypothetical protein GY797_38135 [Deltaproteobacteria bacterium]|nr:hypothetical protein [Deltaproteobacteria bacterium]